MPDSFVKWETGLPPEEIVDKIVGGWGDKVFAEDGWQEYFSHGKPVFRAKRVEAEGGNTKMKVELHGDLDTELRRGNEMKVREAARM